MICYITPDILGRLGKNIRQAYIPSPSRGCIQLCHLFHLLWLLRKLLISRPHAVEL